MTYLWYSGATDVTGIALAEQLGIRSGTDRPVDETTIIGWGCKTRDNVRFGNNTTIINHPNSIRKNRDKLETLNTLTNNEAVANSIATHVTARNVITKINNNEIALPLIGRTRRHQSGKGFWFCPTKSIVDAAITEGADYFQKFIDIKQEYRLHVFDGEIIYAQKKVANPNPASWVAQRVEKIKNWANKHNDELDTDTLVYVLNRIVKEVVLPDRIVRSNKRGWKFSTVRLNSVSNALKNVAINAVNAIGLDFGAVDCALGQDNAPWVIEINSGPGLQRGSLEAYVTAFRNKIDNVNPRNRERARDNNGRFVAVGAAANREEDVLEVQENNGGLARIMQNVQNDREARAVIEAIMRGGI